MTVVNLSSLQVSLLKNRVGANQDQWIIGLGDSHSWGQGSPESQLWTSANNTSVHSANLHNKGFMARLVENISTRRGFNPTVYGAWSSSYPPSIRPGFYQGDAVARAKNDPNNFLPLIPVLGKITGQLAPLTNIGAVTDTRFYSPTALSAAYASLFREKLSTGLFGLPLLTLSTESVNDFQEAGKTEFLQLSVNAARLSSGAGFVVYTNSNNGVYAERNAATNDLYVSTAQAPSSLPSWVYAGGQAFLPGFGLIKFGPITASYGGSNINIVSTTGTPLGATSVIACLSGTTKFYHPAYVQNAVVRVPMQSAARVAYIAVRHKPGGGNLYLYFTSNTCNGGGGNEPYLTSATARLTANDFEWSAGPSSVPLVAGPNGVLSQSPKATKNAVNYQIDTSSAANGFIEEVVYRIDFGDHQLGDLFVEAVGSCDIRGITFDNNKVVNLAMGGHTVGGWLGKEPSFSSETADHIGQILNHVPATVSHCVVQMPLVNEYLRQTPIATFNANLLDMVTRIKNHLLGSNNFNARGVDFIFFTTIRNKAIAWEGAAQSAITYTMYVDAAKAFCTANNIAFIDAEAALFDEVATGKIGYQRLYNDDNHPGDYANERIYLELKKSIDVMI